MSGQYNIMIILDSIKSQISPLLQPALGNEKEENTVVEKIIDRDYSLCGYHLDIHILPENLHKVVTVIDSNDFFLESITGVDWLRNNQLEVVYDFSRYDFDLCRIVVRTRTPRSAPSVPTITGIYSGANWHERETHDFFGIKFQGHPHLIPLLLPEDADFHPLLKDFKP